MCQIPCKEPYKDSSSLFYPHATPLRLASLYPHVTSEVVQLVGGSQDSYAGRWIVGPVLSPASPPQHGHQPRGATQPSKFDWLNGHVPLV